MKLHLGCGEKHIDGYINIDARELPGVDQVDDVKTLSGQSVNSADVIYASHILEHIQRREYTSVLNRWFEILKPGGILRIAVPDIEKVFEHYSQYKDLRLVRGLLWGGQTYGFNYHYCGWDFKTLKEDLEATGFKSIKRYDWQNTEHSHIDDFSACHLPHDAEAIKNRDFTDKHILMSLNVEAVKPDLNLSE